MAGIFDVGVGEVMSSNVTPQTPPAPTKNIALGMLAGAVGAGAEVYKEHVKNQAETEQAIAKGKILSELNNKIETISQAKSSGKYNSAKANMLLSTINKSYMASNPMYAEDIQKFFNSKLGGGWSGGIIKEESEAELARNKYLEKARSLGAIPQDATEDDLDLAAVQGQRALAREALSKANMEELTIRSKKQSMIFAGNSEARAQENNQYERSQRMFTRDMYAAIPYEMDTNVAALNDIYNTWRASGRTKDDTQEALKSIMMRRETARKSVTMLGKTSPDLAKALTSTLSIFDNFEKMVTTTDEKERNSLSDEIKFRQQVALNAVLEQMSPEDANIVLASQALPHAIGLQNQAGAKVVVAAEKVTDEDIIRIFAKNGNPYNVTANPYPREPNMKAAVSKFPKVILGGWKDAVKQNKPELISEYNGQINSYMKSLKHHMGSIERPSDLKPAIELLSDPDIGKWLRSDGADPEAVDSAKMVYQNYYRDQVLKNAENMLQGNIVLGGSFTGQQSNVLNKAEDLEPMLVGDNIVIVQRGMKIQDAAIKSDPQLKSLTGILNSFLKVSSNLEGADVKSTFENVIKPYVFGIQEEQAKGNQK